MKWDDIYEAERIGRKIESGEEVTKEEMMKQRMLFRFIWMLQKPKTSNGNGGWEVEL